MKEALKTESLEGRSEESTKGLVVPQADEEPQKGGSSTLQVGKMSLQCLLQELDGVLSNPHPRNSKIASQAWARLDTGIEVMLLLLTLKSPPDHHVTWVPFLCLPQLL